MSGTRGAGGGCKAINGKRSSGANSGDINMGSIPPGSKKMLQSLKEIVDYPETEIYAMLKECNMDPNETVSRLLSQDQFHQVKSKKEKKKENKDVIGVSSRRTGGGTVNRGFKGGNDRYSHAILSQFSPSESVGLPAKPSYKKDNWNTSTTSSSSGVVGNNINWKPPAISEASVGGKSLTVNNSEGVSSLQQSSNFRSPWSGVPGQVSMADIVKMGRPQVRGSNNATQRPAQHQSQFSPMLQELYSSQNYMNMPNSGLGRTQDVDEWPQDEQEVTDKPYDDPSRINVQCADDAEPCSVRPNEMQDKCSGYAHIHNDELHDSYKVPQPAYEDQEVEDIAVSVSSIITNVQELSLSKEEEEDNSLEERETPIVKIPDHLQVRPSECSHLSFGSFGSVMNATAGDVQSLGHTDSRNSYENDEHVRTTSGGGTYAASQSETLPSPNYAFENSQHWNPSLSLSQISSQVQNLPPLSTTMTACQGPLMMPSATVNEADKSGNLSSPHVTQNIHVSTISEGQSFQLPVHPYSQPFHNIISYPLLPQSYAYMQATAFQPAIATTANNSYHHAFHQAIAAAAGGGSDTFQQSISAGVPPHYKNSVSTSGLPQSAAVPSGYGVFGNSTTAGSVTYEDILRSHYKDTAAHLLSLQQGGGSRTMGGGVPGSAYYSLQDRHQQQQPSQAHQYASMGPPYPTNFYHSQTAVPLDHHQQQHQQMMMSRDGSVMGPQAQHQAKQKQQQQQQAQQMWQNGY